MKKTIFAATLFAAFTLAAASCGGNKTSDAPADADSAVVDSAANSKDDEVEINASSASAAADEAIAELIQATAEGHENPKEVRVIIEKIQEDLEHLKASGNAEAAEAYASKLKTYFNDNAAKLKSIDPQTVTVASAITAIANAPESVKSAAQGAVNAATADGEAAKAAVNAAEAAVKNAPAAVKEAAKTAANAAATKAANDAKAKANAATSSAKAKADAAVEKANKKADEAVQKGAKKVSDALNRTILPR